VLADVAQELDHPEPAEPRGVVDEDRQPLGRQGPGEDAAHQPLVTDDVLGDVLGRQQLALDGLAGRVTDQAGAAAEQRHRLDAGPGRPDQQRDRQQVADRQRRGRRVEADVDAPRTAVEVGPQLRGVGAVVDQPTPGQLLQ
jgi:hypothetical protein